MHLQRLNVNPNDADDENGCGSGECGDDPPSLAVAAAERSALVRRQRFSRFVAAVDSAGASCIAFVVAASCNAMADVASRPDVGDLAVLECEEIDGWRQCH